MIDPLFAKAFSEDTFTSFIEDFIPGITLSKKRAESKPGFKSIQQIAEITENNLDLVVFIAESESSLNARVEITKNTYSVLKSHARSNALVAYITTDSSEWRLSLVTTKVTRTKDGVRETISNPRRFSYLLGPSAKVLTPSNMLSGVVVTTKDLESKFSLAVVSKEFYKRIAIQYSKLVGGTRGEGVRAITYERTLKLGAVEDAVYANFAIRLIGRLVFCWFLKQKKGNSNVPLILNEILSASAVSKNGDYYHSMCSPLFFEVLNKPENSRPTFFAHSDLFKKVPFLNGGLFQDHAEDNHKFNRTSGLSERRGVVAVPDIWFTELFGIFEEYNFTIDENTSIDTELSIDPEMLGRIFENLLAEVNPESGASVRNATGSFYTPREIVDFMVEESLVAHLKTKTGLADDKIRALSSYDLDDDIRNPLTSVEKKVLVDAIHDTSVLDPACGSGAFPIGMLQRMVHMLGVLDPDCSIYLNKIPAEFRRHISQHNPTYVRKLGVIRECIHGVDIQPVAVDISRLRCFLTLVVDQQVDDMAPNRGIEPLPNLDFKFVCANTLIKPPVDDGPLFGDEFATALGELIDEYFAPVDQIHKLETARKLQQLINDKTKKELENILKSYSYVKDETYKQALAQKNEKSDAERIRINNLWGSYENIFQNKPVSFFDTRYFFPAVDRRGGFDIVIGNPPYGVSMQGDDRDAVVKSLGKVPDFEIYYYFIEVAKGLLCDGAINSYILPNTFLFNVYAAKYRKNILDNWKVNILLDCTAFKLFESATVYNVVSLFSKSKDSKLVGYKNTLGAQSFEELLKRETLYISKDELLANNTNWGLAFKLNPNILNIVSKIKRIGKKVSDDFPAISQGLIAYDKHTGQDTQIIKDRAFHYLEKINDSVKEWLWGEDIRPYEVKWNGKEFIDYGPGIANPRSPKFFKGERILIREITNPRIYAAFTIQELYHDPAIIVVLDNKKNLRLLLGILNSKLATFYHFNAAPKATKGAFPKIIVQDVNDFPFPKLDSSEQNNVAAQIVSNVDQILVLKETEPNTDTKNLEAQIDQFVYKLYDLTPEEIEIIENSSKK